MHCHPFAARPNWREQASELGYTISLLDNPAYWIEATNQPFCCVFSHAEVNDLIETATAQLSELALKLVDEVCCGVKSESHFEQLRIPSHFRECIRKSWKRHDRSLYGRFDFAYNEGKLKLLELNFDTPTSLYESAHLQRLWFEDLHQQSVIPADAKQCNSIQEKLVAATKKFVSDQQVFHLGTFQHAIEEAENLRYLQSCAVQAGLNTQFIFLDDIRNNSSGQLVDLQGRVITCLFKLFPWELLFLDDTKSFENTGKYLFSPLIDSNRTTFIEPAWKSILSNKAVLPLLWKMAPNHRFLLEARSDDDSKNSERLKLAPHVRKPIFGREGRGVSIISDQTSDVVVAEMNHSETEGFIIQEFTPLPKYEEFHLVLGSWLVDGESAGISVRADRSKITGRQALFIPHYVL